MQHILIIVKNQTGLLFSSHGERRKEQARQRQLSERFTPLRVQIVIVPPYASLHASVLCSVMVSANKKKKKERTRTVFHGVDHHPDHGPTGVR